MTTPRKARLPLGELIDQIKPSPTLTISPLADSMKARGEDVLSFSAGEPDFDTPVTVKEAAKRALDEGRTKYAAVSGLLALRDAVAREYNKRGFDVTANNVVVSVGAKHSIYQLLMVMLNPGDEVIIPSPYWVSYPDMVALARGTSVIVHGDEAHGFKITADQLEAAITDKTRLLILNTPSNPTGAVYSKAELEALAEVVERHQIGVLFDAIYDQLIYTGEPPAEFATLRPGLFDLTVTVNGLSKSHAMTGWRVGYIVAPEHICKAVSKLQSQSTSGITTFVQYASVVALEEVIDEPLEMREHFDRRRKLLLEGMRSIEGVTCLEPEGAFYAFPNFSAYLGKTGPDGVIANDLDLAAFLLKHCGVALVPGSAFGAPGYARLSYATSDEKIKDGIERIRCGLMKLT